MRKNKPLSPYKIKKILWLVCVDVTATQAAVILEINRYYHGFRQAIHAHQTTKRQMVFGIVERDESYFGPARLRGRPGPRKRGRGTHKQPVFGIFERDGQVYTELMPNCSAATLQAVIRGRVSPAIIVHTDGWRGYDGLVNVGYNKHLRLNKSKSFAVGGVDINGLESFWSFVKPRFAKFNGVKKHFDLHLKECEWRWGKHTPALRKELIRIMANYQNLLV